MLGLQTCRDCFPDCSARSSVCSFPATQRLRKLGLPLPQRRRRLRCPCSRWRRCRWADKIGRLAGPRARRARLLSAETLGRLLACCARRPSSWLNWQQMDRHSSAKLAASPAAAIGSAAAAAAATATGAKKPPARPTARPQLHNRPMRSSGAACLAATLVLPPALWRAARAQQARPGPKWAELLVAPAPASRPSERRLSFDAARCKLQVLRSLSSKPAEREVSRLWERERPQAIGFVARNFHPVASSFFPPSSRPVRAREGRASRKSGVEFSERAAASALARPPGDLRSPRQRPLGGAKLALPRWQLQNSIRTSRASSRLTCKWHSLHRHQLPHSKGAPA